MEDKILVNLSTDHTFECNVDIIGREGEGNTTRLEISVPEGLTGCSVYLDFEKPNGEKFRTPKLKIENGVAIYDVVPYLLTDSGEIKVQAVLVTNSGQTWKSYTKRYLIPDSIDALEEIPEKEDFIADVLSNATNALKGKKSGAVVGLNDVSPIAHTLDVKVRSTNVGSVKVNKLGKNLIPFPYADSSKKMAGITFTVNDDGSVTLNGTWDGSGVPVGARITDFYLIRRSSPLKAGRYYLSSGLSSGSTYTHRLFGHIIRADGSQVYPVAEATGLYFDIKDGDTIALSIRIGDEIGTVNNLTFYPQIELGSVGTEYEPYIAPIEYPVNADGSVDGVKSIYPSTTLVSDTSGAVIDVKYNRDINKAFEEIYNAIISLGGNV